VGRWQGFTWLHLAVPVPAMAYEMNFVFTDGESYDNNGKKVRDRASFLPAGLLRIRSFCLRGLA
jgi:hypothetical protein